MNRLIQPLFGAALVAIVSGPAVAKPARCFTTDDGYFPCRFRSLGADGSFEISGKGVPTMTLIMDQPGFAFGSLDFDARNIPLPGQYVRQSDDPACWANPETSTKACVW